MSNDGSSSVVISASATFMAQSQQFIADAAAPTPPPTPGLPTPAPVDPLSLFKVTPQKVDINLTPPHSSSLLLLLLKSGSTANQNTSGPS
jgi:hypothetical protein